RRNQANRGMSNGSSPATYLSTQRELIGQASGQFRTVSFRFPPERSDPALTPENSGAAIAAPVLHISLSDPNGTYRANGKDAAVISVVFESPDLSPAPADIHIWLRVTNGVLDPPQPLQIKKGTFLASTQLTSMWPAEAH